MTTVSARGSIERQDSKTMLADFDLHQSIEDSFQEIRKDYEGSQFPYRFHEIYNCPEMIALLSSIKDYLKELFMLEAKQNALEKEARARNLPPPSLLPSETRRLQDKATDMASKYSWLLMNYRIANKGLDDGLCTFQDQRWMVNPNELKNQQMDQSLFEIMIYYVGKVLESAFVLQERANLEEELSRLFRTTAFNKILRQQKQSATREKFPSLYEKKVIQWSTDKRQRNEQKKAQRTEVIEKYALKYSIPQEKFNIHIDGSSSAVRPGYQRLNPHRAIYARSPLISLMFPSAKDKIRMFEEERKKRIEAQSQFKMARDEAKEIIRQELRKRAPKNLSQTFF